MAKAQRGIQLEDVIKAVVLLHDKGEKPTTDKLLNMLGSGSKTTLGNRLEEFEQSPEYLESLVKGISIELLLAIRGEIFRAVSNAKGDSESELTRMQTWVDELDRDCQQKEKALQAAHSRHLEQERLLLKMTGKLEQSQKEARESAERVRVLMGDLAVANSKIERISQLESELKAEKKRSDSLLDKLLTSSSTKLSRNTRDKTQPCLT